MECDGDVGVGLRKGICPHVCDALYKNCLDDFFKLDEQSLKYKFC